MAKEFFYGGQAVIEGVMMRGAHKAAIAVRQEKSREIVIHEEPLNATVYRGRIARTPFLRGLVGLWDALGLGTRALMWSADVAVSEEDEKISFTGPVGIATIGVSLLFGIGLFFFVPLLASSGIGNLLSIPTTYSVPVLTPDGTPLTAPDGTVQTAWSAGPIIINLIEGVIQIGLLIGYIWLIGRIPEVKRLFGYHGAEHKTINAYEAGAELTPEVVAKYPIEHPRCGTAFLLTVMLVSVLLFSLIGRPDFPLLVLSRVIGIPVVAGIAYELIRFTAQNINNPIIRILIKPNLALQHLTTREPDLEMLEVAIAAFKRVLVGESLMTEEQAAQGQPQTQREAVPATGD
ncbi:MAG: DUF1385 domain-containing protein [Chloroflexota bacterium]|nr:DUF1385 domain-containing protein [Chloroflexota bacterium]